jgi:poly-gamma-glutamate synthesis protein (capsule biosynthesis protein)
MIAHRRLGYLIVGTIITSALLNACSVLQPPTNTNPPLSTGSFTTTITLTPFQPVIDFETPIPTTKEQIPSEPTAEDLPTAEPTVPPTPSPIPKDNRSQSIWIPAYLPNGLTSELILPEDYGLSDSPEGSQIQLVVGDQQPIGQWVFALVAPYPTITDQVSMSDPKQSWKGSSSGPFAGQPLLLTESTLDIFSAWWGEPAPGATQVVPAQELIEVAWDQGSGWGIVPFESLEPGWKVISIDGQSPLRKGFDASSYPLTVPISIQGEQQLAETIVANSNLPASNRDPNRLTTVALTGVTALVRATAFAMHRNGITYPARDIGEVLRQADITHISNEIPFTPDCPYPNPLQADLRFCSRPEYIELLEEIGTDVVELTGDHFGDWGPEAMRHTLDMYEQRDWIYYGGGYDRKDARKARLIEHNGNKIAFIGCNGKGGGYATASDQQPGAVSCDFDWMQKEIARLVEEGYQVIATFQHFEYYTYNPQPDQVRDFQALASAGASIVSGSQAHQPQGLELYKNSFIHYGLGNLFFDQYHFCTDYACDDGFIDMHVFYDGQYLGNELITIVFEDYARPRLMNPEERAILLNKVFSASNLH